MAGDLIPPPSPAGRPAPDPAETPVRARTEEPPPAPAEAPSARPAESPFRTQFGFLWGVLAGVAVCVAGLTGVLAVTAERDNGPQLAANWSTWKPTTSQMFLGAREIANHVDGEYRLDSGDQLTTIQSGPTRVGFELLGVAVRPAGGELEILDGDAVHYIVTLFDDEDTSIKKRVRDRLLMREAVELALYSFRYLDDVTMVTVELRAPGDEDDSEGNQAVFFRPGDLLPQLQKPLADTLGPRAPRPADVTDQDIARIDALALRHRFDVSIRALDPTLRYLVLSEPAIVDGS